MAIIDITRECSENGQIKITVSMDEEKDFTNCSACNKLSFECTRIPKTNYLVCVKCMAKFFDEDNLTSQKLKVFVARTKIQKGK